MNQSKTQKYYQKQIENVYQYYQTMYHSVCIALTMLSKVFNLVIIVEFIDLIYINCRGEPRLRDLRGQRWETWGSVHIPPVNPEPHLVNKEGGKRRTKQLHCIKELSYLQIGPK